MKLEELKAIDNYGAFKDFVSVKEAKQNGLIPIEYANIFPDTCTCGSDYIITNKLTLLQCCNTRCVVKMGYSLAEMFSRFGCKGIGEETCKTIIKDMYNELKLPSHVEILNLCSDQYPECLYGSKGIDFAHAITFIKANKYSFGQMISLLAIPEYGEEAKRLFGYYNSIAELVEALKNEGGYLAFLNNRGVKDPMKAFYLSQYIKDILLAETILFERLRERGLVKKKICITGTVYPNNLKLSRNEFVNLCNEIVTLPNGSRLMDIEDSDAMESVNFIIADSPSNSAKYRAGLRRGVLISSTEFITMLNEEVNRCIAEMEKMKTEETK